MFKKSFFIFILLLLNCSTSMAGNFTDNGNGTVTDSDTGLVWQKEDDNTVRTWEGAINYCEGLSIGAFSDWRLPNVKELESIIDDSIYSPAINSIYFPNTNDSYWTSTTYVGLLSYAWLVDFHNNEVYGSYKTINNRYVRCVRGGQ